MKKPKKFKLDGQADVADGDEEVGPSDGAVTTERPQPDPEEDFGGGDICSPEPSTDDDMQPDQAERKPNADRRA